MKTSSVWCKELGFEREGIQLLSSVPARTDDFGKSLPLRDLSSGVLQVVFKLSWSCRSVV